MVIEASFENSTYDGEVSQATGSIGDESSSSTATTHNDEPMTRRTRSQSNASEYTTISIPSIHNSYFGGNNANPIPPSEVGDDQAAPVSSDQERQILLLMLLAQVCALHDPTPRTFTVHVLELFERGILDRDSIHFLFELGLVPSLSPVRALLTNGSAEAVVSDSKAATRLTIASHPIPQEQQRAQEASAIRSQLEQQEQQQEKTRTASASAPTSPNESGTHPTNKPWDVEHFPLSLSRYQREFTQVRLINAGSFGQVFHSTRKMDLCDYAVKKIAFDASGYSNETIQQMVREVKCLATANEHPNIVRYYTSWLEPSWMTGSGKVESNIAQHKLLTDLQHLVHRPQDDTDGEEGSSFNEASASVFSNEASSSFVPGRRRFSFDNSVDSMDEGWEDYRDFSLVNERRAYDDSDSEAKRPPPPKSAQKPQPQSPIYRYQICLYIQMQLCHPATLADWIRERNRRVPEKDHADRIGPALAIFHQIANGLTHVHEKKIIHRDLKPANIFSSKDGKVIKIGDFGLSKQMLGGVSNTTDSPSASKTTTPTSGDATSYWDDAKVNGALVPKHVGNLGQIVEYGKNADPLTAGIGTASYASPEQVKSRSYGTEADIFSLGLILLELMCCFETEHERLHNFQQCRQQMLPSWIHEHYPDVAATILACTLDNPSQRPLAKDLVRFVAHTGAHTHHDLHRQLSEKDEELEKRKRELAEKDCIIEEMRLEMECMKCTLLTNVPPGSPAKVPDVETIVVEEATSFQSDDDA
jgi:serine/threonine protein kinase